MSLLTNLIQRQYTSSTKGRGAAKPINGFDWLPNRSSGRSLGTTILGARGSGKSLPTFKELCWGDLLLGIPQLILDPVGSSAYLLDKVWRAKATMPEHVWWQLVNRIVYLDFGAYQGAGNDAHASAQTPQGIEELQGPFVPSWPLLYRFGHESAYEAAARPIDMIAALSPELAGAPIEGMPTVAEMLSHAGIVLLALDMQLTELDSLLTQTKRWDKEWGLLEKALQRSGEAQASVEFLRRYSKLKPELQDRRTKSLLNQIRMLQLDPTMRAIFGSTTVAPWQEWEAQGACVIADFQHVRDLDRRRWCMMAVYDQFLSYKLSRGLRSKAWALKIEEVTQLLALGAAGEVMAAKLDALLNVYGRNYQIYTTLILQELFQLPLHLQEVVLAAGNLMIGNQASAEGRRILADYFFPYTGDVIHPKRIEPIYAGQEIVDYRPVEWSQAEQRALASQAFIMRGFHFLVKAAKREGDTSGGLRQMVVQRNLGEWVQDEPVSWLRQLLVKHKLRSREAALQEINGRVQSRLQEPDESATLAAVTSPAADDQPEPSDTEQAKHLSDSYIPGVAFQLRPAEDEADDQDEDA